MPTYGILHDFRRPSGDGYVDYYRECLTEIELADELGYDTVWLSEHHLTPDGLSPAPLVLAAAIAARTTPWGPARNSVASPPPAAAAGYYRTARVATCGDAAWTH